MYLDSLSPGRCGDFEFQGPFSDWYLEQFQILIDDEVNTESGNKPLPEQMLTKTYD